MGPPVPINEAADTPLMNWPVFILSTLAGWCMLRLLAGDRATRMRKLQARLHAAAQAAAHPARPEQAVLTVGGPGAEQIQ